LAEAKAAEAPAEADAAKASPVDLTKSNGDETDSSDEKHRKKKRRRAE
jgi:hypothetical protein